MRIELIKNLLNVSTVSKKNDVITVRQSFFYTHGRTTQDLIDQVKKQFPTAEIIDAGEIWKSFRGGASVAQQSHWFVKFKIGTQGTEQGTDESLAKSDAGQSRNVVPSEMPRFWLSKLEKEQLKYQKLKRKERNGEARE